MMEYVSIFFPQLIIILQDFHVNFTFKRHIPYIAILFSSLCISFIYSQMFDPYNKIAIRKSIMSKAHHSDEDTSLEWIMKRGIRTILEVPTKDQIYDNVSFKLGAFYKRFWENKYQGLKQNTRKAGQIIALAENMQEISREDDRLIKVCAYARQVKKFQAERYEEWKRYIWADFNNEEKAMMDQYVENLTPPVPFQGESKSVYDSREKQKMFAAYKYMRRGMLLVQVFQKIWTIRMYRKNNKSEDVKRHLGLATQMLAQIKAYHPTFRGYLSNKMGLEEWQEIEQLW